MASTAKMFIGKVESVTPIADTNLTLVKCENGTTQSVMSSTFHQFSAGDYAVWVPSGIRIPITDERFSFIHTNPRAQFRRVRRRTIRGHKSNAIVIPLDKIQVDLVQPIDTLVRRRCPYLEGIQSRTGSKIPWPMSIFKEYAFEYADDYLPIMKDQFAEWMVVPRLKGQMYTAIVSPEELIVYSRNVSTNKTLFGSHVLSKIRSYCAERHLSTLVIVGIYHQSLVNGTHVKKCFYVDYVYPLETKMYFSQTQIDDFVKCVQLHQVDYTRTSSANLNGDTLRQLASASEDGIMIRPTETSAVSPRLAFTIINPARRKSKSGSPRSSISYRYIPAHVSNHPVLNAFYTRNDQTGRWERKSA